jgi:hypothetical protein
MLKALSLSILAFLLGFPAAAAPPAVEVAAVALDPANPGQTAVGKAIFRGGLALASEDPAFGGWSDLLVAPDGSTLLAIGDQGAWMTAVLQYDSQGNLAGAVVTDMGRLKGLDGADLGNDKETADAEALAPGQDGGYLVAFERQHRIWLYSPDLAGVPVEADMPLAIQGLKPELANNGIEALSRLADGRLIMFLEGAEAEGGTLGFVHGKVTYTHIPYIRQDNFQITGSAPLPDGGLLLLERFWSEPTGALVRVRRMAADAVGKAITLPPLDLLLDLRQPLTVDNFEGIAAWQDATGKTRVLLLSDDNFNRGQQRTLLLDFELVQ